MLGVVRRFSVRRAHSNESAYLPSPLPLHPLHPNAPPPPVIAYMMAAFCPTLDVANAAVPTLLAVMLFLSGFLIRWVCKERGGSGVSVRRDISSTRRHVYTGKRGYVVDRDPPPPSLHPTPSTERADLITPFSMNGDPPPSGSSPFRSTGAG